jgi:hypothetical protein
MSVTDRPDHTGNVVIYGTVTITGSVSITGTVVVTGDVNITNPVITITPQPGSIFAITGSVTITSGTVSITGTVNITGPVTVTSGNINVATAGGTNIIVDKLVQGAYIEKDRTSEPHSNNGVVPTMVETVTAGTYYGKFFPRGCRGFIYIIEYYTQKSTAGNVAITFGFSPYVGGPELFTVTETLPGNTPAAWRWIIVCKPWNYDGLFMYIKNNNYYAYDLAGTTTNDSYATTDYGETWTYQIYRAWFRAYIYGQTVGDIPVSGTVNNINIPNTGAVAFDMAGTTIPAGTTVYTKTFYGAGRLRYVVLAANHYFIAPVIQVDGQQVLWSEMYFQRYYLFGFSEITPGLSLIRYNVGGDCTLMVTLNFEFKRKIEIGFHNFDVSDHVGYIYEGCVELIS